MSRPALSVFVFGIYLLATALVLILSPNTLLGLIGVAPATEPWIFVLGVVVFALGLYYITAARAELVPFFRATVWIRVLVLASFIGLVIGGTVQMEIIGFGLIDVVGAVWTWAALRGTTAGPTAV